MAHAGPGWLARFPHADLVWQVQDEAWIFLHPVPQEVHFQGAELVPRWTSPTDLAPCFPDRTGSPLPSSIMSMTSTLLNKAAVFGTPAQLGKGNATACRASARFGGTKQLKKEVKKDAKKAGSQIKKAAGSAIKGPRTNKKDDLWLPNTTRPAWLDGSLPGDRGFDPLGLARPVEYLQYDVDSLDQNLAVNKAGSLLGKAEKKLDNIVSETSLQPYSEVFGLERFRENELIHGRWAMLACLGVLVAEASTGVAWQDAGKIELDGAQYLGFRLPFTITQLLWIEAILVGGAEVYRNGELDLEKRLYPGGYFDPLGFASDPERAYRLKTAEIKHGRLAMVAFLGFSVQAAFTGKGALSSLATAAASFKDAV